MRKIIRVAMIAATACVLLSAARNRRNRFRPLLLARLLKKWPIMPGPRRNTAPHWHRATATRQ